MCIPIYSIILDEIQGKKLAERSTLMAKKWRELPRERKDEYKKQAQKLEKLRIPMDNLTSKERKDIVMKTPSGCKLNNTKGWVPLDYHPPPPKNILLLEICRTSLGRA